MKMTALHYRFDIQQKMHLKFPALIKILAILFLTHHLSRLMFIWFTTHKTNLPFGRLKAMKEPPHCKGGFSQRQLAAPTTPPPMPPSRPHPSGAHWVGRGRPPRGLEHAVAHLRLFLIDVGTSMAGRSTCFHRGSHFRPPLQTSFL